MTRKERFVLTTTLLQQLLSLAAAGTLMLSSSLDAAAPHQDEQGLLFLVNRQWRISQNYVPVLQQANVPGQLRSMRADAALALEEMFAACKEATGATLQTVSGYRSYQKQNTIYNNKLRSVGSKEKADQYVARPGASEHQLGMAMDVGQKNKTNLSASFASTSGGRWVQEHCWEYGFIIRYGQEWVDVTGYQYEPWHVRYVGKAYAQQLHEQNIPLETFLILLRTDILTALVLAAP